MKDVIERWRLTGIPGAFDFDRFFNNIFTDGSATHTYGNLYDPERYDLVEKVSYVQKEIESLKSSKKQYKEAIVGIDKKIEELEKRIE